MHHQQKTYSKANSAAGHRLIYSFYLILARKMSLPDSDPASWHIQDQFSLQEY
jgi:hypothetical protein